MQVVDFDQPVGITWEQTSGAIQLAVDAIKRGDIDEADAEVTMPFGTDVRNDDRLRIGGAVYKVTSLNSETSDAFKAAVRAMVRRKD